MAIEKFIQDGQDPKVLEKIHDKIIDMLTAGEFIQYISLQKKPAVTLLPDSITVSNKRIFLCEFTKLGLATNFEIFSWSDIKDIAFKEEIFGSKVTVIPLAGENLTIDYIPKVQARKLYQLIKEALENSNKTSSSVSSAGNDVAKPSYPTSNSSPAPQPVETEKVEVPQPLKNEVVMEVQPTSQTVLPTIETPELKKEEDDELTQKLKKLKTLYDRQLITQAEYESKKSELLSQL
ncbi:PH domain-containing protein [Sphingobacterium sp. LRF_L2]|uniref:PH domain-containing protein n=1 Tax=Sphingobacterium sp. LRF_L2 TaxID=3369421 RepID=UPI003F5EFEDD